jgi:hypothetical protein
MCYRAVDWAEEIRTAKRTRKTILMVLARRAKSKPIEGGTGEAHQCYPSHQTIATRAGCSVDTVERAIKDFVKMGLLVTRLRYNRRGRPTSNIYFLNVANEEKAQFEAKILGLTEAVTNPQNAAKEAASLTRKMQGIPPVTNPQFAGDQYLETSALSFFLRCSAAATAPPGATESLRATRNRLSFWHQLSHTACQLRFGLLAAEGR